MSANQRIVKLLTKTDIVKLLTAVFFFKGLVFKNVTAFKILILS